MEKRTVFAERGTGAPSPSATVSVTNVTVADNTGGGIGTYGGATTVVNSIVWGNGDDLGSSHD
jgi:hypothetical protein